MSEVFLVNVSGHIPQTKGALCTCMCADKLAFTSKVRAQCAHLKASVPKGGPAGEAEGLLLCCVFMWYRSPALVV
eukprot:m.487908 g.487908  ORF g.487908 m.487908 type:complete len:75 (+) comp57231_c0_seq11:356-580(+)